MKLSATGVALAMAIAGCATQPPSDARVRDAPDERVYQRPAVTSAEPASIEVIRDVGHLGSAVAHHVLLNGQRMATLEPGERFAFHVDPGWHVLGLFPDTPFRMGKLMTIETQWRPGQRARYRSGVDGHANPSFVRDGAFR